MGQKRKNLEAVTDYADDTHFIRLHRDIVVPAAVCESIRRLLAVGRWDDAKSLTLEHAPANAMDEIRLFFEATAQDNLEGSRAIAAAPHNQG